MSANAVTVAELSFSLHVTGQTLAVAEAHGHHIPASIRVLSNCKPAYRERLLVVADTFTPGTQPFAQAGHLDGKDCCPGARQVLGT